MALKTCKECKKDISSKVNSCPNCGAKQGYWFERHPYVSFFLIVLIYIIYGRFNKSDSESVIEREINYSEVQSPKIDLAEFQKIKAGMSYSQVVSIIGGSGTVMSESGSSGDPLHTIMYSWEGQGGFGANANIMFQGGKMINKAQFGLK